MKAILFALAVFLVGSLLCYAGFAFVEVSFNPAEWTPDTKKFAMLVWSCLKNDQRDIQSRCEAYR